MFCHQAHLLFFEHSKVGFNCIFTTVIVLFNSRISDIFYLSNFSFCLVLPSKFHLVFLSVYSWSSLNSKLLFIFLTFHQSPFLWGPFFGVLFGDSLEVTWFPISSAPWPHVLLVFTHLWKQSSFLALKVAFGSGKHLLFVLTFDSSWSSVMSLDWHTCF